MLWLMTQKNEHARSEISSYAMATSWVDRLEKISKLFSKFLDNTSL